MNNKLISIISVIFVILVTPLNAQTATVFDQYLPLDNWVQFYWSGDSIGDQYYDKLAIKLPLTIGTEKEIFSAQFDLGANVSSFYGKNIRSLFSKYPILKKIFADKKSDLFENITVSIGNHKFTSPKIYYKSDYGQGIDSNSKDFLKRNIGTIGSEIFSNKILIIDYPNTRINIVDSLPLAINKHFHFVPINIANYKPIISISVADDTFDFLFDTGSSIFPFLVRSDYIATFVDTTSKENLDSLEISSWGEKHFVVGYQPKVECKIGTYSLPQSYIYTFKLAAINATLMQDRVVGVMGNYYFYDKMVIVDYKNQRFGISK